MIKSFSHKGLRTLFETDNHKGIDASLSKKLRRQLDVIDAAAQITDIDLPGYGLHELKGERKGTWAVKVTGNWRITFTFKDGDASDVDLEDYH